MNDDWGSEAIISAFPRKQMTYYLEFITDPRIIEREAQGGRRYKVLGAKLRFYSIDSYEEFHEMGWAECFLQPCVYEDFLSYGRESLMGVLWKCHGVEHKQHVDLVVDKMLPPPTSPPTTPDATEDIPSHGSGGAPSTSGPSKPAAVNSDVVMNGHRSERGQPGTGGFLKETPEQQAAIVDNIERIASEMPPRRLPARYLSLSQLGST